MSDSSSSTFSFDDCLFEKTYSRHREDWWLPKFDTKEISTKSILSLNRRRLAAGRKISSFHLRKLYKEFVKFRAILHSKWTSVHDHQDVEEVAWELVEWAWETFDADKKYDDNEIVDWFVSKYKQVRTNIRLHYTLGEVATAILFHSRIQHANQGVRFSHENHLVNVAAFFLALDEINSEELVLDFPNLDIKSLIFMNQIKRPRYFVQNLLLRGYLDTYDTNKMIDLIMDFEYRRQQSAHQSFSALSEQSASLDASSDFKKIIEILDTCDPDKYFYLKEESLWDGKFNVGLDKDAMLQLSDMLVKVQEAVIEQVRADLCGLSLKVVKFLAFILIVWGLYEYYLRNPKRLYFVLSILALIGTLVLTPMASKWIYDNCLSKIGSLKDSPQMVEESYSSQIMDKLKASLSFIPVACIGVMDDVKGSLMELFTSKNNTYLDAMIKRIGYFGDTRIVNGIKSVGTFIMDMLNQIKKFIYVKILGYTDYFNLDDESTPLEQWTDMSIKVIQSIENKEEVPSAALLDRVHKLYVEGIKFMKYPLYKDSKDVINKITISLTKAASFISARIPAAGTVRNPPLTVYIHGQTGVGKSAITYPVSLALLYSIKEKEDPNSLDELDDNWQKMIYVRAAEQQFWDGYNGQEVCLFDDFNQQVDSPPNPSLELFELIRASNVFPYPLHMAELEDKGTTYFTSKVILASSNNSTPKVQSLNYPEALQRRFDVIAEVTNDVKNENEFSVDGYRFKIDGKHVGFEDFIKICIDKYNSRKSFVSGMSDFCKKFLRDRRTTRPGTSKYHEQAGTSKFEDRYDDRLMAEHIDKTEISDTDKAALKEAIPASKVVSMAIDEKSLEVFPKISELVTPKERKSLSDRAKGVVAYLKEKHPYLVNISRIILYAGLIVGGFMLSKSLYQMFTSWSNPTQEITCGVNDVIVDANSDDKPKPWDPNEFSKEQEAYTDVKPAVKKAEGIVNKERVFVPKPKSFTSEGKYEEGAADSGAVEVSNKIVHKNFYKLELGDHELGFCIFLSGRIALVPFHFKNKIDIAKRDDPDVKLKFIDSKGIEKFVMFARDAIISPYESEDGENKKSRDMATFVVNSAHAHSSIEPYLITRSEIGALHSANVFLPIFFWNGKQLATIYRYAEAKTSVDYLLDQRVLDENQTVLRIMRDGWQYNMDTARGFCGAPLFVRNKIINTGKILGMHVAGDSGGNGFSTAIYKEDFAKLVPMKEESHPYAPKMEFKETDKEIPGVFTVIGELEKSIYAPIKTRLKPSLCHGDILPPITKPAFLKPSEVNGEEFSPRDYRLQRLGKATVAIDAQKLRVAKEVLTDELKSVLAPEIKEIRADFKGYYTFDEAVLGEPGSEYVNPVKRDTSPGFPWVVRGVTRKKMFGIQEVYDLNTEHALELRAMCSELERDSRNGIIRDPYFVDTLKDERRPIDKAHKTRLFSAGPIDYLIVCKQFFNGVVAALQVTRNRCHISVGTNVYSTDWHYMSKQLLSKSPYMGAGDFEGFDASQNAPMLRACMEILRDLSQFLFFEEGMPADHLAAMEVLSESLVCSHHISENIAYRWSKSLPSGHYLTAIVNSLFVNLAFLMCYGEARGEFKYFVLKQFYEKGDLVTYGDDHVVSFPIESIEYFNELTLPGLMKTIGLFYTLEDKDSVASNKWRKITEVTYLKRHFRWDLALQRWVAPLKLDVVLEMPNWIRSCVDEKAQTFANIECALRELSLHEQKVFEEWGPLLVRLGLSRCGVFTPFNDYKRTQLFTINSKLDM